MSTEKQIQAEIDEALNEAENATKSDNDFTHLAWLIDGIEIHRKSDGKMGHSVQDAKRYVVSSAVRIVHRRVDEAKK